MNTHTNDILEGLRPRMQTARVAHVRRMMAGIFMVPLIGFGAIAVAAETADEPAVDVAGNGGDGSADGFPDVTFPEIGDAEDDEFVEENDGEDDDSPALSEVPEEDEAPAEEEQTKVLSLGPIGDAEVFEHEGELDLLETHLESGWEIISIEVTDDGIVIAVTNGDVIKIITITSGVRDEIDVRISDFEFPEPPTTTTEPPPTTTTEKPWEEQPPVVDRFVVEVPGKGSFVVEREGETLWVGNVETNEGFDYDIEKGEGWKVIVRFTNGEWNWYGKALINDFGEVEQHFWDEEVPAEPIYQWVEVPEVGAVQFKLWSDGLIYVKNWETAEGIGFYNYNGEGGAEVGKVDFEGEGVLWIVEAWENDDGGISWSTTNALAE